MVFFSFQTECLFWHFLHFSDLFSHSTADPLCRWIALFRIFFVGHECMLAYVRKSAFANPLPGVEQADFDWNGDASSSYHNVIDDIIRDALVPSPRTGYK
jgi:hypothetical protein